MCFVLASGFFPFNNRWSNLSVFVDWFISAFCEFAAWLWYVHQWYKFVQQLKDLMSFFLSCFTQFSWSKIQFFHSTCQQVYLSWKYVFRFFHPVANNSSQGFILICLFVVFSIVIYKIFHMKSFFVFNHHQWFCCLFRVMRHIESFRCVCLHSSYSAWIFCIKTGHFTMAFFRRLFSRCITWLR